MLIIEHNNIHIHNSVLWDCSYFMEYYFEYSHIHVEYWKYYVEYCQSYAHCYGSEQCYECIGTNSTTQDLHNHVFSNVVGVFELISSIKKSMN